MAAFSPGLGRADRVPARTSGTPAPGALLFGRYRLEELLGQGGMAEVWRARDEDLDRLVAIKILHRHLLPDERSRERFAAEARAVAGLSHPGIVTVHDIAVDENQAAMILELVGGEPLSDVIAREGRVTELGAAAITAQVAHALQAAHDRGLVHRDVKPANVLVSTDGHARLVDFGIARALDDHETGLTLPGTIMGTLRYMAPEQLSDGAADRATDVFGLGSLLYEMLVGRPPFPGATPAALMAQQRQGAPAMLRVSPELAGLARTALQSDAERRPRSAGLMAALLERCLEHRGISSIDLAAVAASALHGTMPPKAAPTVQPRPAITPAPILEPGASSSAAADLPEASLKPKRRRSKVVAGDQLALGAAATAMPPAPPPPVAALETLAVTPAIPMEPPTPVRDPASVETATVAAPRRRAAAARRFGGRRVPLVTAIGLAGVLLAALLLAGALAALQAGTTRPTPSASGLFAPSASPTPIAPSPTPSVVAPSATAAAPTKAAPTKAAPTKADPAKPGPPNDKTPRPKGPKRRDNTG